MLEQQLADHANGTGLGHAPALHHLGAEIIFEALQHGARHGGTANADPLDAQLARVEVAVGVEVLEQDQPDRGHTLREGDALIAHQLVNALAVQMGAGKNELGTHHGGGVGHAPGVGVEHGNDQQQGFI